MLRIAALLITAPAEGGGRASGTQARCALYVEPARTDAHIIGPMLRNTFAFVFIVGLTGTLGWLLWSPGSAEPVTETVAAPAAESPSEPPALQTESVEIRRHDTIVAALRRHEVPARTAHEISRVLREAGARMRQIRPGDRIDLSRDAEHRLVAVAYAPNPWVRYQATANDDRWQGARNEIAPEVRLEMREGAIENSLWDAVRSGAVTPQLLLDLVQVFESELDFSADVRPGDRFRMLVETRYVDGTFVDHGRILAAQFFNDGQTFTGVGFGAGGRFAYYDSEGRSLKKLFLRSPLEFTRISSGFTHRRPHPVLGGVRPHLAIDYAAPTGTPVWAVADGVVRFAGRKGGNGIQVLLRHRAGYETYYNHLSRVAKGVRPGVRVAQKQVIGYVGSTGLSTGPHLDYRVSRNSAFVNPLSEKFLPGAPIPEPQRTAFLAQAGALIDRLERDATVGEGLPGAAAALHLPAAAAGKQRAR